MVELPCCVCQIPSAPHNLLVRPHKRLACQTLQRVCFLPIVLCLCWVDVLVLTQHACVEDCISRILRRLGNVSVLTALPCCVCFAPCDSQARSLPTRTWTICEKGFGLGL